MRLNLEVLGERIVLAVFTWTGDGADNLISNGQNWDQAGAAPGANDDLRFTGTAGPNSGKFATFDAAAPATMGSIQLSGSFDNAVNIDRDLLLNNLLMNAPGTTGSVGVLAGRTLKVGQTTLLGGSLVGAGTFEVSVGQDPTLTVGAAYTNSVDTLIITPQAFLNVNADHILASNTVTQQGTVNWANGNITVDLAFTNTATGQFKALCDKTLDGMGNFVNQGQFRKESSTGTTTIDLQFNGDAGANIQMTTGTLLVRSTGNDAGVINATGGATFTWDGGPTRTVPGALTLTGQGVVTLGSATTLEVGAGASLASNVATLRLSGGSTFKGPGTATITGKLDWRGGMIQAFQSVFLGPGLPLGVSLVVTGPIDITTVAVKTLDTTLLRLTNTTTWTDGNIDLNNDSRIENYGTFDIQGDNILKSVGGGNSYKNLSGQPGRGIVKKTAGAGETVFDVESVNSGDLLFMGRTFDFRLGLTQTAGGVTTLGNGTLKLGMAGTFTIDGGTVTGGGTINGSVTLNDGFLTILTGTTLTIRDNYEQAEDGTLTIQYRAGTLWGLLAVGGDVTLDGDLAIDDGGANPGNNWQDVLTAGGTITDNFANTPNSYQVEYTPAGAVKKVRVKFINPEP